MKINYIDPTKEDIMQYLQSKGFETKEVNNQIVTNKCPFCQDAEIDWTHFYLDLKGRYCCHKCGARGNLIVLAKHFGDYDVKNLKSQDAGNLDIPVKTPKELERKAPKVLPQPLNKDIKKMKDSAEIYHQDLINGFKEKSNTLIHRICDYLITERGFSIDTLKHFKIGWTGQSISIPYFEKGNVVNIRFRKNPFDKNDKIKKMYNTVGGKMTLFNSDVISQTNTLVITEGEFDAMSLYQKGWKNVISISCGANTFKQEWAEMLKKQATIYLCYDNDIIGTKGTEVAIDKLGAGRCYRIVLPKGLQEQKKDLNDFFVKDKKTIDNFHELFNKAEKVKIEYEHIKHIKEFAQETKEAMQHSGILRGLSTGYPLLDNIWSGMRKGDLIVISGDTGLGKTFIIQNIILNLAREGVTSLLFSLEQPIDEIIERFLMLEQFDFQAEKKKNEVNAIKQLDLILDDLKNMPVYLYSGYENLHTTLLGEVAEKGVKDFGCEVLFIDHLHYFAGGDRRQRTVEIGDIIRYIKLLARKLNIPIILVCHLRKLLQEGTIPTLDDLKDSSSIKQDADIVGLLYRKRNENTRLLSEITTMNIDKNRHGRIGKVNFIFGNGNEVIYTKHTKKEGKNNAEEVTKNVPLCVFEEIEYSDNETENARNRQINQDNVDFKQVEKSDINI